MQEDADRRKYGRPNGMLPGESDVVVIMRRLRESGVSIPRGEVTAHPQQDHRRHL